MSRRNPSGFTGANAIPLGSRNKAIGSKRQYSVSPPRESYNRVKPPSPPKDNVSSNAALALKAAQAAAANLAKLAQLNKGAGQPPNPGLPNNPPSAPQQTEERGRPRKKRSRWSQVTEKTEIPGMPAAIASNLTAHQQKAYIVQLQIEDITRKIKSGDLGIPINPEHRSPSPEPIYNGEGKRMNTREYRTRKKLEEERHKLIQQMQEINADYKPPMDYKPMLQRVSERVVIPQDLNPNINFVGLLIGPRGNTLKKIEKESNCKIMIRGKGSVKEGKIGRKDGQPLPGEDEPLHALVSGTSLENVQGAVKEINIIIKQGIEQPEENNDLRKLQLMELAKLNGTLREDLMPKERQWLKPENQNVTNTTVCMKCGGRGHLEQDCRAERPSVGLQQPGGAPGAPGVDRAKMDSEYMSLMAELGEGPTPSNNPSNQQGNPHSGGGRGGFNNNYGGPRFGGSRPPWGGGNHGNGGPRFNGGGGRGGRFNNSNNYGNRPPMMNQNQPPPPPWMQNNPYPPNNQWGPPMGGPYGGYGPGDGETPPWMQGDNNMGGPPPPMFDPSGGGGNFYNQQQPPPPPPSNNPQPPPPPSSGGNVPPWQQADNSGGGQGNAGGYNDPNMMGYGAWGGSNSGAPGPVPPPMPTGPGPVPPPPPGDKGGMDYGNMGYGGYMAPPPPPPQ